MNNTATKSVREALIEAARHEFAEQGYAGAKTREIAQRAATSEVMLFRHFRSKANLFKEAVFRPMNECIQEFVANELNGDDALSPEKFVDFSSRIYRLLEENGRLMTALIVAYNYEGEEISGVDDLNSLDEYFNQAEATLRSLMTEKDREFIPDPAIMVRLVFGLIASVALFRGWLFPKEICPIENVVKMMQMLVVRGQGMPVEDLHGRLSLTP